VLAAKLRLPPKPAGYKGEAEAELPAVEGGEGAPLADKKKSKKKSK